MGLLRIAEAPIRQRQGARHDQRDRRNLDGVHSASFFFRNPDSGARSARPEAAIAADGLAGQSAGAGASSPEQPMPPSSGASTLDDSNQEHDERDNQKDVDESTQGVRADQSKNPQDEQDDCDGP
jgi:hypothetical protein